MPGMPLPAGKKQLEKLGDRLAQGQASEDDWILYGDVLDYYDQVKSEVQRRADAIDWSEVLGRPVEVAVTGRTKTLDTLVQKLKRTSWLKLGFVQDIAGVRLVADVMLFEQDVMARRLQEEFDCPDAKIVDRRIEPQSGYRALHVILRVRDVPVEVQLRTELQALWADLYERLADSWGRQMRYGELPDPLPGDGDDLRARTVAMLHRYSGVLADYERTRSLIHDQDDGLWRRLEAVRESVPADAPPEVLEEVEATERSLAEATETSARAFEDLRLGALEIGSLLAEVS